MAEVLFLRHGESRLTEEGLVCGHLDPPLSAKGIASARAAAAKLRGIHFDKVLSSPLKRCKMTLTEAGFPVFTVDPGLIEINFGKYDGRPYEELVPSWHTTGIVDWSSADLSDGDDVQEFFDRAGKKLISLLDDPADRILAGSHYGFIGSAIASVSGKTKSEIFEYPIRPASVVLVRRESGKITVKML